MAEEGAPPLRQRLGRGYRQYRFLVAIVILAAGVTMTVLAVGDFTPLSQLGPFPSINGATDQTSNGGVNYNLVFVVAGPIVVLIGGYLVGAYIVARRKFEHLMLTRSKAEFLRNIPELEDLLWELTPDDEVRYGDKRAELRVRR